ILARPAGDCPLGYAGSCCRRGQRRAKAKGVCRYVHCLTSSDRTVRQSALCQARPPGAPKERHGDRQEVTLARRIAAEFIGTAMLLAVVVGSGIMGERLAGGNLALALLGNSIATGGGLLALILVFGEVSGAHFNPAVTLALAWMRRHAWRDAPGYLTAQFTGAILGVWVAHTMFGEPILQVSQKLRPGVALMFSEAVATFGLLMIILGCARRRPETVPYAVAAYIVAAYWFTASTSFANPAVTVARALTNTFAGIRPLDAPGFIASQVPAPPWRPSLIAGLIVNRAPDAFLCVQSATARPSRDCLFVNLACRSLGHSPMVIGAHPVD